MESAFKPHVDSIVETASAIASREKLKVCVLEILASETQFKSAIVCSTAASPVHLLLRRVGRQSVSSGEIGDD